MSESSCSIAPSRCIKVKAKIWCTHRCGTAHHILHLWESRASTFFFPLVILCLLLNSAWQPFSDPSDPSPNLCHLLTGHLQPATPSHWPHPLSPSPFPSPYPPVPSSQPVTDAPWPPVSPLSKANSFSFLASSQSHSSSCLHSSTFLSASIFFFFFFFGEPVGNSQLTMLV